MNEYHFKLIIKTRNDLTPDLIEEARCDAQNALRKSPIFIIAEDERIDVQFELAL